MKRLLALLLAASLGLAACGNGSPPSETGGTDAVPQSAAESAESMEPEPSLESTSISTKAEGTVASSKPTPGEKQSLYLWEEGNVPAVTEYTVNNGGYSDDPDFRPYLTYFPVPEGTEVKGAVLICAGGAFQYRSDWNEGRRWPRI